MERKLSIETETRMRRWARVGGGICIAVGAVVILGWILDVQMLKSVIPGFATMKGNTALGFILVGISIRMAATSDRSIAQEVNYRLVAFALVLLGGATLYEFYFNTTLRIDEMLFDDPESVAKNLPPGRMSIGTALGFGLSGLALLLLDLRYRSIVVSEWLAGITTLNGLLAIIGYLYGVEELYRVAPYSSMAIHTATAFVLVGLCITFLRPRIGFTGHVFGQGAGGYAARRLLPIVSLAPIFLGWLRVMGERRELYDMPFGSAIATASALVILTFVILWTAISLNRYGAIQDKLLHDLQETDRALRHTNQVQGDLLKALPSSVALVDHDTKIVQVNHAWSHEENLNPFTFGANDAPTYIEHCRGISRVEGDAVRKIIHGIEEVLRGEQDLYTLEYACLAGDERRAFQLLVAPIQNETPRGAVIMHLDITARKRLEEQLIQAQRMESIGRLAGGIAHDFNNLLTAILGSAELALTRPIEDKMVRDCLTSVMSAAESSATLTKQLLAFSRKQIIEPRIIDVYAVIHRLEGILRRLIGEHINLSVSEYTDLWPIFADPGQIEQVLLNLAANARDAMPEGGKLTIEFGNVHLDNEYVGLRPQVEPGDYVLIAVSDTGEGMPDYVKQHAFEPFFTTKGKGKGTGLGLATCYGIIKQHRGYIWIYSEPNRGTTFKVYLPRSTGEVEAAGPAEPSEPPRGDETVLIVEDEPIVRTMATELLKLLGYTVITASSGPEALDLSSRHEGKIDLLLTDVVMPEMSGRTLADELIHRRAGIKVIFVSGYSENAIVHHGVVDEGIHFLQKPYTLMSIARKVRQVLDAPAK